MVVEVINNSKAFAYLCQSLRSIDTLLLDVSFPRATQIARHARDAGVTVIVFSFPSALLPASTKSAKVNAAHFSDVVAHPPGPPRASFFARFIAGETRAVFSTELSRLCDPAQDSAEMTYRMVSKRHTLSARAVLPLCTRRVLHVIGSSTSEFYQGVSDYYGYSAIDFLSSTPDSDGTESTETLPKFEHFIAYVHFDGSWSVAPAASFDKNSPPRLSVAAAIGAIVDIAPHVVQPHLYDFPGLTAFRSLFAVLGLPLIGCSGDALALSTHKARTNAVARAAGVPVAPSVVVRQGADGLFEMFGAAVDVVGGGNKKRSASVSVDDIPFELPMILKPAEEDNSLGVMLVRDADEFAPSLQKSLEFGGEVLVEKFIPLGRELRVAVIESESSGMTLMPIIEYYLNDEYPIRTSTDKLQLDKNGTPVCPSKYTRRRTPAPNVSPQLHDRLKQLAFTAHKALGCTDYSIFDVRVNPDDEPFMLESSLYCSYCKTSVIVLLAEAAGTCPKRLFENNVDWAIARREVRVAGNEKSYVGMKLQQ